MSEPEHRSIQERFVREISSHLLGAQSVFKPSLYRNGEEPADLIWLIGRCAVIMNVTSGNKSLQSKRKHNNSQMHRWLRRWKAGEILRGPGISIPYSEVDHIIGISVVGGPDSASLIEGNEVIFAHTKGLEKLCACATLTEGVLERLAKRSVGIKDILVFVNFLRLRGGLVNDQDAIQWIDNNEAFFAAACRSAFANILPKVESLNESWRETKILLAAIKNQHDSGSTANIILADLAFPDAVWLSVAERSLSQQIAKPGEIGVLVAHARRDLEIFSISVTVVANTRKLASLDPKHFSHNGFGLISCLEPEFPVKAIVSKADNFKPTSYAIMTFLRDALVAE